MRRTISCFGLCAALLLPMSACSDDDSAECGNGKVEGTESCDGSDLGGATCASLGLTGGELTCTLLCTHNTSGCQGVVNCGNGQLDSGEQCEGTNLNGRTCSSLGLGGGTLACSSTTCQFDTTGCEGGVCGNGAIEGDEQCDTFELGGATCESQGFAGGTISCRTDCTFNTTACYNEATMPVGDPCLDNAECTGGLCLLEAGPGHWGPAGGYCYENCDENGGCPGSGQDGVCVVFTGGAEFCMLACDPTASPSECRPGYECQDLGEGVGVCFWGHCTDDSQCTVTGDCETDELAENYGWCVSPEEDCSNGVDDDFDGRADCADTECIGTDNCPMGEICGNNSDDDADGAMDCADAECANLGICSGEVCEPPTGAVLTCGATLTGQSNDAQGSTDQIEGSDCVSPDSGDPGGFINEWGPEYAYTLTVTEPRLVTVTVSNFTGDLDVYIIKEILGECDAYRGCFAWGGNGAGVDEVITFAAYPGMNYYVVVDGFQGNISTFDIAMTCATTGHEICNNSSDDDNDGLVDCNDPECWGVSTCNTETNCGNGQDDDLDGAVDCYDSDCAGVTDCQPGKGYWEMWERGGSNQFDLTGWHFLFTADPGNAQGYTYDASQVAGWIDTPGAGSTTQNLAIADEANTRSEER
ncbi:MAG: PPC domain-containing protein, partial [Polyangia bacterium]|nr:PPC domain-containing protein [Polyangia bacterium]